MRVLSTMALVLTLTGPLSAATTFYVAPGGSDDATGTEAAPFATLQRARDEVRALKAEGDLPEGGARIEIADGTYFLAEPLTLGPEDSGGPAAPIVYAAADDARPVISGGRRIAGLTRQEDGSWTVTIPEATDHRWVFRQLFISGRRYIYARSPNEGQYHTVGGVPAEEGDGTAKDRLSFKAGDIEAWPNIGDVEVMLYFSWNAGSFPLKSVDTESRVATLGSVHRQHLDDRSDGSMSGVYRVSPSAR